MTAHLRVGLTVDAASLPATLSSFPAMHLSRIAGGSGKGIPGWKNPQVDLLTRAGKIPWISFRDWPSDTAALAMINTWLDQVPEDVPEVWLTYHPEPSPETIDSRTFRLRWVRLATAVRAHRNRAAVRLIPVLSLNPVRHKLGDRFNADWTTWEGIWQPWAPTDSRGEFIGDAIGWSCFTDPAATRYEEPEPLLRTPIGAAMQLDRPLVIADLATQRIDGDELGTGRARWITDVVTYLRRYEATAVLWPHAVIDDRDFRLTDTNSTLVWRKATEGLI
jgi:hypothetical protein